MDAINGFFQFIGDNQAKLLEQMLEHVGLTFFSLLLAMVLAIPLGIYCSRNQRFAPLVLGIAGVLQTIPSIALLGFMIPLLGIGIKPAIFALFLYAILPILRNTYTGIQEVDPGVKEAALGMGLTPKQVLYKVELPLALPVLFAGIRTATVINVGVATLAAYIGAGGLGEFIFGGIALNNSYMILAGAIPAAVLAVLFDQGLAWLQQRQARPSVRQIALLGLTIPLFSAMYTLPQAYTSGIRAGFDPEFLGRADGYYKLADLYDLDFNTLVLNAGLMYEAVENEEVEVISGYSTDGRIKSYNLKVLEDDKNAFPPYYCAPLLNLATAKEYPELLEVLNLLSGKISDEMMTELNYQVDFEKKLPAEVAKDFLVTQKLWKPDRQQGGEVIRIGSKIFTEQYILVELFSQLINGYTGLDVESKAGLGGTKICFDALKVGEIDIYPEYTGTGFIVIAQPDAATVERLISDRDGVYEYVKAKFEEEHGILWLDPLGFNNTYALMVKEVRAQEKGWERIGDLR
ncbi:MAG: ABC transporter permease/substrate-binding protein [Bacteroidota bacterium]